MVSDAFLCSVAKRCWGESVWALVYIYPEVLVAEYRPRQLAFADPPSLGQGERIFQCDMGLLHHEPWHHYAPLVRTGLIVASLTVMIPQHYRPNRAKKGVGTYFVAPISSCNTTCGFSNMQGVLEVHSHRPPGGKVWNIVRTCGKEGPHCITCYRLT